MIDRFLQSTVVTATVTFDVDGVDTVVTAPTVTITRADGTVVVTGGTALATGNTGQVSYTLSTAQTALLDRLRYDWTGTVNSVAQHIVTYVDIVGGYLVSLSDLKALYPAATSDELAYIRAVAEERLENACGQAFVPRFRTETGTPRFGRIRLSYDDVSVLRFVTQGSVSWTSDQLANPRFAGQLLYGPFSWGRVTVGYEHGDQAASNEAQSVALIVAQEEFPPSGQSRDQTVVRAESDNQVVWYAKPVVGNPFVSTRANQFVRQFNSLMA